MVMIELYLFIHMKYYHNQKFDVKIYSYFCWFKLICKDYLFLMDQTLYFTYLT